MCPSKESTKVKIVPGICAFAFYCRLKWWIAGFTLVSTRQHWVPWVNYNLLRLSEKSDRLWTIWRYIAYILRQTQDLISVTFATFSYTFLVTPVRFAITENVKIFCCEIESKILWSLLKILSEKFKSLYGVESLLWNRIQYRYIQHVQKIFEKRWIFQRSLKRRVLYSISTTKIWHLSNASKLHMHVHLWKLITKICPARAFCTSFKTTSSPFGNYPKKK